MLLLLLLFDVARCSWLVGKKQRTLDGGLAFVLLLLPGQSDVGVAIKFNFQQHQAGERSSKNHHHQAARTKMMASIV